MLLFRLNCLSVCEEGFILLILKVIIICIKLVLR